MKLRVEVTPSGAGWLMLGDAVLADFEDPALARAFLAVARAARRMSRFSVPPRDWHTPGEDARRATFRALARLDRVSGERKGGK